MKKKTYLFLIFCMILTNSKAQSFINGSFENTTSSGCDYNNNASDFNAVMKILMPFRKLNRLIFNVMDVSFLIFLMVILL